MPKFFRIILTGLLFKSRARQNFGKGLQRYNSPTDWDRKLLRPSTDSASLLVEVEKKFFCFWFGVFWGDVTSGGAFCPTLRGRASGDSGQASSSSARSFTRMPFRHPTDEAVGKDGRLLAEHRFRPSRSMLPMFDLPRASVRNVESCRPPVDVTWEAVEPPTYWSCHQLSGVQLACGYWRLY